MSLINQMLQDLDARRAANGPASGLPNDVRPLPPMARSRRPTLLVMTFLLLLAAGAVWYSLEVRWPVIPVAPPAVSASPVPPISPARIDGSVAPDEKISGAEVLQPVPASLQGVLPDVEGIDASLRLARFLEPSPERKPATRSAVPAPAVPPVAPSQVAPIQAAVPKIMPPPSIEKSAPLGSLPERAEADYQKALAALNQGRLQEALDGLAKALHQHGQHVAARQLLFKLLVENRRFDEAGELLQEGLRLLPSQIGWAMSLARLQVDRGDLPRAWQILQHSLPAAAGSADYQGFAAHVLQRLGRLREAVDHYQLATRLAPAEGRWWLGLGLAEEAAGHPVESREALLRAKASGSLGVELSQIVEQKLR